LPSQQWHDFTPFGDEFSHPTINDGYCGVVDWPWQGRQHCGCPTSDGWLSVARQAQEDGKERGCVNSLEQASRGSRTIDASLGVCASGQIKKDSHCVGLVEQSQLTQ
jgi:hypothetical protein